MREKKFKENLFLKCAEMCLQPYINYGTVNILKAHLHFRPWK